MMSANRPSFRVAPREDSDNKVAQVMSAMLSYMYDISDDGLSIRSVIHMPVGVQDRFRGLRMGYDNALYATTDSGNIMKISAE